MGLVFWQDCRRICLEIYFIYKIFNIFSEGLATTALLPLITIVTLSLSGVFSGALITETVFAYQGVGKLVYDSIIGNDFNVAMISFIISVTMVLIMNLLADILYGFADPRISFK